MNGFHKALLWVVFSQVCLPAALAADDPLAAIKDYPERRFFESDKYGLPKVADKNKESVARIVTSQGYPAELRSLAVYALAISGYSPESFEALRKIAMDTSMAAHDRDSATMGLQNFWSDLSDAKRKEVRLNFRELHRAQDLESSDQTLRASIIYGNGPWIAEQLGSKLSGHRLEIEIDASLPDPEAMKRLIAKYQTLEGDALPLSYDSRAEIGRALIEHHDKRGIDILDTLLDAGNVPLLQDGAPSHQYRSNVFRFIQRSVGKTFGYEHLNYDPSIDEAIARFRKWWLIERYKFGFPTGGAQ